VKHGKYEDDGDPPIPCRVVQYDAQHIAGEMLSRNQDRVRAISPEKS